MRRSRRQVRRPADVTVVWVETQKEHRAVAAGRLQHSS